MHSRPLSSIVEELNNVLTVLAMCADEVERGGPISESVADMRDAVRRASALTREIETVETVEAPDVISQIVTNAGPTVLVVEEKSDLRREVACAVEGRGAQVVAARNVREAFHSLESVRSVDLLVVDTTLEGRHFASRLGERYPGAAVVYTGGDTTDESLGHLVDRIQHALAAKR